MRTIARDLSQIQFVGDLVVFVQVVEKGSFTAAALALNMAKSQVTKQVSRLEKSLGVTLLHRTTRQMTPTQAGLSVLQHAKAMVQSASAAAAAANLHGQTVSGRLSVSSSMAYGQSVMSQLLPGFTNKYPLVEVELLLTDRQVDLLHDDVDIVIRLTDDPQPGLVGKPVHHFSFVVACTPEYLLDHPVTHPLELKKLSCMAFSAQPQQAKAKWKFSRGVERLEMEVRGPVVVNSSEVIRKLVLDNLGIGLLPDFLIGEELKNKNLVAILDDWDVQGPFGRTAWMLWKPHIAMPPAMRAFVGYATEYFAEMRKAGGAMNTGG